MDLVVLWSQNLLQLANEASPWLILGLIIAGLMKTWVPTQILTQHLGKGKRAIVKAAFIGAPLPLCSCGVIPVASQLRRSGASPSATSAFLVATPETGVDSVSVSYALLGPVMAIYRPFAAIMSAIITGFLVLARDHNSNEKSPSLSSQPRSSSACCSSDKTPVAKPVKTSCCSTSEEPKQSATSCHPQTAPALQSITQATPSISATSTVTLARNSSCCSAAKVKPLSWVDKTLLGFKYAFTQLLDDIVVWLFIGLVFATTIRTFLATDFLLQYGSGLVAMLVMICLSIPMYICATASTPIAAGFIMAGISPGTALVFMMAGPATNISTLGVIKKEMGSSVLTRYLLGVALSAIGFGLLLDAGLNYFNINISEQMSHSHELLPAWFALTCTLILIFFAIKPLRRMSLK
ncbi:SO_0444 family Cu/Zn efflux transporter [Thalassotalea aquiviva]|uniref:SO_0444 family Cu/Zn efflux transporter n=1 Tax=Thalassotalea aquiviva TaxID=3242415 RepID=UPI00352BA25E